MLEAVDFNSEKAQGGRNGGWAEVYSDGSAQMILRGDDEDFVVPMQTARIPGDTRAFECVLIEAEDGYYYAYEQRN